MANPNNLEKEKRIFLKPGGDNKEERMNFVKFWAEYIQKCSDKEWSSQQNILINSIIPYKKNNGSKAD